MSTPKDIIDKVVFGGLYKVKSGTWNNNGGLNDQCYYLAVPIMDDNGDLWMQDTYQLKFPSMKNGQTLTEAAIERLFEFGDGYGGWAVKEARYNYYYKNQMKITSQWQLDHFELIADLHDYRPFKPGEDYRDYNDDDVLHGVKLYFEHGYSWNYGSVGVKLVRKDAKKNPVCVLESAIQDVNGNMEYPLGASSYRIKKMNEAEKICINEGLMNDELGHKLHQVRTIQWKLEKMRDELDELIKDMDNSCSE